jgi:hypothetical protein
LATRRDNYLQGKYEYESNRARGMRRYRMTVADYDRMLEEQGGVCKICGSPPPLPSARSPYLCVDHDHESGRIRGLLCFRCNTGLHYIENWAWRNKAEVYLGIAVCPESLLALSEKQPA